MEENTPTVELYRRLVETSGEEQQSSLQQVASEEAVFTRPTLLCCGPILNNTKEREGQKNVNGFAKYGYGLLSLEDGHSENQPVDVVNVMYPEGFHKLSGDLQKYNEAMVKGQEFENTAFAMKFTEDHFLPLLKDADGNRLETEAAMRNLRNINVLGSSYGCTFIEQVGNHLVDKMEELGYSSQQIDDITAQVSVLTAGMCSPLGAGKANFTTVNLLNLGDAYVGMYHEWTDYLKTALDEQDMLVDRKKEPFNDEDNPNARLGRVGCLPAQPLTIMPIKFEADSWDAAYHQNENSRDLLVLASQPLFMNMMGDIIQTPHIDPYTWRSDPFGKFHEKDEHKREDDSSHQPPTYLCYGIGKGQYKSGHHGFMMRNVAVSHLTNSLSNSVLNHNNPDEFTPLATSRELINSPKEIAYEVAEDNNNVRTHLGTGYQHKIDNWRAGSQEISI